MREMFLDKEIITIKDLSLKIIVILIVLLYSYFASDYERQLLSWMGLVLAFLGTIVLKKHFMPFMFICVICYLTASTQEFWSSAYEYLPITKWLWTAGNAFLPMGIFHFIYRLIFKYKIQCYQYFHC